MANTANTHMQKSKRKFGEDDIFTGEDLGSKYETQLGPVETMEEFLAGNHAEVKNLDSGSLCKGTIVKITHSEVYVDIKGKTEGIISKDEFSRDPEPKIGQEIEVLITKVDEELGHIAVSKNKARLIKAWDVAEEAHQKGEIIKARITSKVKGGLSADFNGLKAFVPGSLMSLTQEYDLEKYVNEEFDFKIIELNRRRRNMVLSRKAILEQERKRIVAEIFERLKAGDVCKGRIKNITDYGAFVSLEDGKIDGLLHKADMSWAHVRDISKFLKVGEEIEVKVLGIDKDNEKISLGLKQLQQDPWNTIEDVIQVGDVVDGQVKNVTHFGAFVEIREGIEGLVHISDMSWTERVKHPKEIVNIDDKVTVKVLNIDHKERKIALGMKQVSPDPWTLVGENYQVGEVVNGCVKNLTDFGAFVELQEGVEGLVHISDMSWTGRVKHPGEIVKSGDMVDVKILELDPENKRISLGLKQVNPDPWELAEDNYAVGSVVSGKVKNLADFGAFVELPDGIEGMIHISDFSYTDRIEKPSDVLSEGQEVTVKILEINAPERRISLGLKQTGEEPWSQVSGKVRVGDILTGKVTNLTTFGAFVELQPGVEGLVHISDFSWTERVKHPSEKVQEGQEIQVKVLEIDRRDKKISLGIKHVSGDPMDTFLSQHPVGSVLEGTVSSITDFGAFIKLSPELEGLVHSSQISTEHVRPSEALQVGNQVKVKILEADRKERRIRLSMRQAQEDEDRKSIEIVNRRSDTENSIGDMLDSESLAKLRELKKDL